MKKVINIHIFVIIGIALTFTACDEYNDIVPVDDPEVNPVVEYPSLMVVNELDDSWRSITGVSLVGYEFYNLNIEPHGDSQTFVLDEGMSGGYEDIYLTVRYIRYSGVGASASIKVDFHEGETTTITLTGCSGKEGCSGIYLE